MSYEGWLPRCSICKQSVNLNVSKADEFGRAVHENCYVSLLIPKKKPPFLARIERGEVVNFPARRRVAAL